jgi:two-component system NtrC family sensor kinase
MPLRRVPYHRRLSVRLTAAIAVVLAAALSLFALLALRAQRTRLEAEAVRGAALLSDTIRNSGLEHMLDDRRDEAYALMDTIGKQEGIEKVRIFNKEGRVTFSTQRAEIGSLVDKRAESCYACHAAGQPLVRLALPSRSRVYTRNGHRVLAMVTPVYNEPRCSDAACHAHPAEQQVLGVVDVGVSLAEIDHSLASLTERTLGLALAALLIIALGVVFFVNRVVMRPVAGLLEGTRLIAMGDLGHRIPSASVGELGLLAESFNHMTDSLQEARAEIGNLMNDLERQVQQRTAALRQAHDDLLRSEKLASLGRLSASIAHEINNPLSGILTFAKLLIRTLEDGPQDQDSRDRCLKNLRLVERETARCTAIVRNLLDFARERPLTLTDVDLNQVLSEALSLLEHQLGLKSVSLNRHLEPLPTIPADFGQLRQAVVNLVLNAADAMAAGGQLTVSSAAHAEGVELEVADTGTGIPPEHLARIFDPFFTTKDKGTGLGLSVVYGIVERHGGRLEVKSEVGKGTAVRIRLPLSGARTPASAAV